MSPLKLFGDHQALQKLSCQRVPFHLVQLLQLFEAHAEVLLTESNKYLI